LSRNPGSASWPFRIKGKLTRIDVKGPVSADSAEMLLQLAIAGAGILRLSEHVVARSIHEGLLQPLLQDAQDPQGYCMRCCRRGVTRLPRCGLSSIF